MKRRTLDILRASKIGSLLIFSKRPYIVPLLEPSTYMRHTDQVTFKKLNVFGIVPSS